MTAHNRRVQLIDRRKHVGLSQEQLAEAVGVSVSAISCWERGTTEPLARHRQLLADALQVDLSRLNRLIDPTGPLQVEQHGVDHWLDLYQSLIQGAGMVRHVETIAIPALFQTRAYADVVERITIRPLSDDYVAERVELRLQRQSVLRRRPEPLRYQVLIDESVLTPNICTREVMAEQLDHLDRLFHEPNIDIRILPPGRGMCARGGFELVTKPGQVNPFLAITFDVDCARYEQRQALLADFVAMHEYLLQAAFPPAESLARIRHLQRSYQ